MSVLPWRVIVSLTVCSIIAGCGGSTSDNRSDIMHRFFADTRTSKISAPSAFVTLPGKRAGYAITKTSAGYVVTEVNGGVTTYPLTLQAIQFSDMTVNLTIAGKANAIADSDLQSLIELYIAFFNRVPDADGLEYWIEKRKAGFSIDQIADSFYKAAVQYSALTGYSPTMSSNDFVRLIYKNVLGRSGETAPPDADVQYWANELGSGRASKGALVRTILSSAHSFVNDSSWGWVASLLNNKYALAYFLAVQQGVNYNTAEESLSKTMAIAAAITPTDINVARANVGYSDPGLNLVVGVKNNFSTIAWNSTMESPQTSLILNPNVQKDHYFRYYIPNWFAKIDLTGNGLDSLVVTPSYYSNDPELPIELWVNKGNGVFENQASKLIDGPIPTTGIVKNIFVADFNGDGKDDIFITDTGHEMGNCSDKTVCRGHHLTYLLSQPNGKWKDVSSTVPNNVLAFNHTSSMASLDGNGVMDIIVTRMSGSEAEIGSLLILKNDGSGNLTKVTSTLPLDIRYGITNEEFNASDFQSVGSNTVVDLDNDGTPDLVTASYGSDLKSGKQSIRLYKQSRDGVFSEAARMPIATRLLNIEYGTGQSGGLGAGAIYAADLNHDRRTDLLIHWEGWGKSFIQIMRNDGGWKFTDVTLEWLGTYDMNLKDRIFTISAGTYDLRDIDNDGNVDIVVNWLGNRRSRTWCRTSSAWR